MDYSKSIKLINDLNKITTDKLQQQKLMAFAVAGNIAIKLPLTSESVGDPIGYYTATHKLKVMQIISELNECVVFDTEYAKDLVGSLWFVRYHSAYPCNMVDVFSVRDAHPFLSDDDKKWADENIINISIVNEIITDMTKSLWM